MTPEASGQLKKNFPGPLKNDERRLLEDMVATINFTLENNLNFGVVLLVLGHDLREISQSGSVEKSLSEGFEPKARGFR